MNQKGSTMDALARQKALSDGRQLLLQRRLEEALLVSSELTSYCPGDAPDAAEIFAFHGDVLDELGKTPEAVLAYERVLSLQPDSHLDQIRLTQLRAKLAPDDDILVSTSRKNRNLNWAALAAGVVMVASALGAIWTSRPATTTVATLAPGERVLESQPFYPPAPVPNGDVYVQQPTEGQANSTDTNVSSTNPDVDLPASVRIGPVIPGSTENRPGENGTTMDSGFSPLVVPAPNGQNGTNTTNNEPNDGDITDTPANDDPPPSNPGVVQITPGSGSGSVGNSQTGSGSANVSGGEMFAQGRDAQSRREFAKAASLYEQAIRAGVTNGSVYQRLGQCYQNLNRKSEAISAYRKAIDAYRRQAGGNQSMRDRDIAACEAAIRSLGG
ncbi:MAG: tetratricopeptide repeat protein [Fimbriimonadaceae bacterium]|nr:tetratricopeptide repeat protein [Fimbriimonadaceae bacterium]